ncbi:hypothetical protein QJQ45_006352 [Haematococcus lacustris]|nr:hypothetical protein QJQ45_006352 [Haematococcus lacustris]
MGMSQRASPRPPPLLMVPHTHSVTISLSLSTAPSQDWYDKRKAADADAEADQSAEAGEAAAGASVKRHLGCGPHEPDLVAGVAQPALRQYNPAPRPKQDLEELVPAVEELPFLSSSSQV